MPASYPKPDGQKVTRHEPKFGWTDLPVAGRTEPAPELPDWRKWMAATGEWWTELWSKPQACAWEQDGSTLWTLACLYDDLIAGRTEASKVSAEMRQHEDRHGLNPKAMLQLRWRLVSDAETLEQAPPPASADRKRRLKVV